MRLFIAGWLSLLLLAGCAHYVKAVKQPTVSKQQAAVNDAASSVHDIEDNVKAYIKDEGMARLETAEIAAVQADLETIHLETDEAKFMKEVEKLEADWRTLVVADELLQVEDRA